MHANSQSNVQTRLMYDGTIPIEGNISSQMVMLGSIITHNLSNAPERQARVAAAKGGFHSMGRFWFQDNIPFATKRLTLLIRVQNKALSGLEPFVWEAMDCGALDSVILHCCRMSMGGRACEKTELDNEVIKHRSLTNFQVWQKWKILPCRIELRVRRLTWLQQIASDVRIYFKDRHFDLGYTLVLTSSPNSFLFCHLFKISHYLVLSIIFGPT